MGLGEKERIKKSRRFLSFFSTLRVLYFLYLDKKYRAFLGVLSICTWCALAAFVLPLSLDWEILEKEKTKTKNPGSVVLLVLVLS